jgi:ATP-dependent Clp protease ATP-binding subunit ClpC
LSGSPRAPREIVPQAREEARELGHRNLGPEHILLALLRERESLAAQALSSLDITIDRVRSRVVEIAGPIMELPSPQIPLGAPFTLRGMRVLELAAIEATSLGADQVGAEQILLGLVREHEGVAARILREHDADPEKVQHELIRLSRPEEPPGASAER